MFASVFKYVFRVLYSMSSCIGFGRLGSTIRVFFIRPLLHESCRKCKNIYIGKHVKIVSPDKLLLGNNISIHDYCYLDCSGSITIGNDVSIAHDCSIISFNHTYYEKDIPIKFQKLEYGAIKINKDCWLGCKVILLANVEISEHSIVAAGAVVTKSMPPHIICAGNPAKIVKSI